jgi:lipopolysaccharide heptosyltransferase III
VYEGGVRREAGEGRIGQPPRRRALVIRRRYLGDVILLGPALRSLRAAWPDAHLAVLTNEAYAGAIALNRDLDQVLALPPGALGFARAVRRVRQERFTHVLDLDARPRTAWLALASGAPVRIGLRRGNRGRAGRAYSAVARVTPEFVATHHVTQVQDRVLRELGVPPLEATADLTPSAAAMAAAHRRLAEMALPPDRGHLLVHPGSRSRWRLWPAEAFAAACDRIVGEGTASVSFIAGPGEAPLVEAIRARMVQPSAWLRDVLALPELAALIACFDVLLCHDSGPMHLAAAVGTRVVALYGSQGVELWHPLGEGHVALAPPLPCRTCVAPRRCRPENAYANYCVRNISPERVIDALRGQLRWARPA